MVKVQDTHSNDLKLHPYHKDPDQYGSGTGVKSGFFFLARHHTVGQGENRRRFAES
jgi:hypothetical protein